MSKMVFISVITGLAIHTAIAMDEFTQITAKDYASSQNTEKHSEGFIDPASPWNKFKKYAARQVAETKKNISEKYPQAKSALEMARDNVKKAVSPTLNAFLTNATSYVDNKKSQLRRMKYRAQDNFNVNVLLPLASLIKKDAYLSAYEKRCQFNRMKTADVAAIEKCITDMPEISLELLKSREFLPYHGGLQDLKTNTALLRSPAIAHNPEAAKYVESFIPYKNSERWQQVEQSILQELRKKALEEVRAARIKALGQNKRWTIDIPFIEKKRTQVAQESYDNIATRFQAAVELELHNEALKIPLFS